MNVILLSGGSGKRLWPLSNDVRSKQFIKIFKGDDGKRESMLQHMYHSIKKADPNAKITIATLNTQVSEIINQLGNEVNMSVEPFRKDTFPAIALAISYLHDVQNVGEDEAIIVCPVDPLADEAYFDALTKLDGLVKENKANITLMGTLPSYPSENHGYIIPTSKDKVSKVDEFKEKPNEEKAKELIEKGALWNTGVLAFKLSYGLKKAHELIDFKDYYDLLSKYENVEKVSFYRAVVEQENSIQVMKFDGQWKDIGSWDALTESMTVDTYGDVELNETCENVKVINGLNTPIVCMGVKDLIIATSLEGILVTTPKEASSIKPIVKKFDSSIKFAEETWGRYRVINDSNDSLTLKITIKAGLQMPYRSHEDIDKVWTIISGKGIVIIKGEPKRVESGDVLTIKAGSGYAAIAETDMKIIEIQINKNVK